MNRKDKKTTAFSEYIHRTLFNKLGAMALILCALVVRVITGDATALGISLLLAIPLFLSSKKIIY